MNFKTHTGETPSPERFLAACREVAEDYRENGRAILVEDAFASHVTPEGKRAYVQQFCFTPADRIETGEIKTLSDWQRVNAIITGECVALLP